jgi:hypothetical protein
MSLEQHTISNQMSRYMHTRCSHLPQLRTNITFFLIFASLGEYFPKSLPWAVYFLPVLATSITSLKFSKLYFHFRISWHWDRLVTLSQFMRDLYSWRLKSSCILRCVDCLNADVAKDRGVLTAGSKSLLPLEGWTMRMKCSPSKFGNYVALYIKRNSRRLKSSAALPS